MTVIRGGANLLVSYGASWTQWDKKVNGFSKVPY